MFVVIDTTITSEKKFKHDLRGKELEDVKGFVKLFKNKVSAFKYIKRLPDCELIEL